MADRPACATLYRRRAARLLPAALVAAALFGAPVAAPSPVYAAECVGDECEAPPPAPEDPTPGTAVVEGPGNPPPSWPAETARPGAGRHGGKGGHHGKGAGHHGRGGHGKQRGAGGGQK
jgi:hypothetical protein